ncbi:MAG: helix-turn-helix domain-containing protein [Oscillospiraceae bacterium]|jgi:tellurite methyltransferase|nr:helix-turn-helix domain-containing protein [Oscillospiraceae bacterium]
MNRNFGDTIKALRAQHGLTQEQLAGRLNVSAPAVSKWERGESFPDVTLMPALAAELGVSTDKLFGIDQTSASIHYNKVYDSEDYYWGVEPSTMCYDVLRYLPPTRPLKLLDIGCGEGKDAVFFARCGYIVSAFDLSEAGIEKARSLAEKARVTVNTFTANLLHYRLTENYDILYSSGVFAYIKPDLRAEIMANYKSHVNDGGLAAFQTFVNKPFIPRAPEKTPIYAWKSGELFTYFHDWYIENCCEYVFDCNSSGVPHKHAANRMFARNIKEID